MLRIARQDRDTNVQIARQLAIGPGNSIPTITDPRNMIISRQKVYTISRSVAKGSITVGPTLPTFGALSFQLSDLPGSTDFTSLFDQYKFQQVRIKFVPASLPSVTNAFHLPPLFTVIDYDDAVTPLTLDQLRQYSTLQIVPCTAPHVRTFSPRLAVNVFGAGIFGNFSQARLWCDSGSPTTSWYGLKFGLDIAGSTTDFVYYIECEYVISFRSTF